VIELFFGIPRTPPESIKMTDTMLFFDSGGVRGMPKNSSITKVLSENCTLFPGHSHYFWDRFFHEIADALHVFQKHAFVAMKKLQFFMKIHEISNFERFFNKIADTPQVFQKRALVAIKNLQFL